MLFSTNSYPHIEYKTKFNELFTNMQRQYQQWFSPNLQRNMELLVFGHAGARVLLFPTRTGRFFDYENYGIIETLRHPIEMGWLQIYTLDSIDQESFYCFWAHPQGRIDRHVQYENYILQEVIPFSQQENSNCNLIAAGCSMGAFHAVNIAFRHPHLFAKVVGLSGRYDLNTDIITIVSTTTHPVIFYPTCPKANKSTIYEKWTLYSPVEKKIHSSITIALLANSYGTKALITAFTNGMALLTKLNTGK